MKKSVCTALMLAGLLLTSDNLLANGDAAKGETKAATCAACHGSDGNSAAPSFPKIAGLGEKYLYKQLNDIKVGERKIAEMTGLLDNLNDQDLWDLAAYFSTKPLQLSGAKDQTLTLNSGETISALKLGEKIYRAGNTETGVPACSGCHSPRGLGNAPAGFPRLGGQFAQYIEKQLYAFRKGERANDGDARTMRSVSAQLSDAEVEAVAAYISGLN